PPRTPARGCRPLRLLHAPPLLTQPLARLPPLTLPQLQRRRGRRRLPRRPLPRVPRLAEGQVRPVRQTRDLLRLTPQGTESGMPRFRTAFALLLAASAAYSADWPQWLGPRRDGTTVEKVAPWKDAPKVLWRVPLPKGYACPVVAQGRVFVHSAVPDKNAEEVIALDAASGEVRWRDAYDRAPYQSVLGSGPRATPAVVGGRVYTCP